MNSTLARKSLFIPIAVGATVLLWAYAVAQQELRPTPGPTSGIVDVRGSVEIANTPTVVAAQGGEWRVGISTAPPAVIAAPAFVTLGRRYSVTWTGGESETLSIVAIGHDGWLQVQTASKTGHRRWVNLASARAVEEAQ